MPVLVVYRNIMNAFIKNNVILFFFVFFHFVPLDSILAATPLTLKLENLDGKYIGKHVEYLSEKKLFKIINLNWNIDPVFKNKIMSGELHSDKVIRFDINPVPEGYRADLSLWEDNSKKTSVEWGVNDVLQKQVSDKFVQSWKSIFRLDFTPHSWWLRFKVSNETGASIDLVLELDKHFYNTFDLFIPGKNGFAAKRGNFAQDLATRESSYKNLAFSFTAAPGISSYFIRVDSWFTDIVPLRIWSKDSFSRHVLRNNALLGVIAGIFIFILFYSIFIYFIFKDQSYLYLSFMTICGLMLHLASSGFGFQFLWPENALVGFPVISLGFLFSYISFLLFCRSFIDIKRIAPKTDKLILVMVVLFSVTAVSVILLPMSFIKPALFITMLINYVYYLAVLYPAIIAIKRNKRAGKFLIIGILLYFLSNFEWILSNLDIIPYNFINYIHIKGVAFLIIMTLGLADKINFMKKSLADLNISLEDKVDQRTEKLMQTTREVQIANEQLKELDKAKTRFFSNVSHELRTPLTLILAPIESFLKGDFGKMSKSGISVLESMQRNTNRLIKLINDLLDFSKIEARKMELKISNCNISSLLSSCISGIEPAALAKDIDVFFKDNTNGITAPVDPDLLEKAVLNLLSNAMKFNHPKGSIMVNLAQEKNYLEITVKNTGIGIPEDKQNFIFERFSQVDSSSTRKYEGTGIGLALTKEIIQLHRGSISVVSSPGEGAQFTITLPIQFQGDLEAAGTPEIITEPQPDTADKNKAAQTILIVEDNPDMQDFLNSLLQKCHATITAVNGKQALDLLEQNSVDMILADLMMPEMDGYELIQKVRAIKQYQDLPIMILTAKADIPDKIMGFEKGANDYMTKPFSPDELMARIQSQLKFKKLREQYIARFDQKETKKAITEQTKEKINIVKAFIKENFAEQIDRERLAVAVDMSPDHLGRTFKQYTGEKISSYLNRLRIDQAKRELLESDKKIIDIAFEVGFESLRTFNKVFHNLVGISPSSYRKKD